MVCVCRVVHVCVYEQMLQLYPDERHKKKVFAALFIEVTGVCNSWDGLEDIPNKFNTSTK